MSRVIGVSSPICYFLNLARSWGFARRHEDTKKEG